MSETTSQALAPRGNKVVKGDVLDPVLTQIFSVEAEDKKVVKSVVTDRVCIRGGPQSIIEFTDGTFIAITTKNDRGNVYHSLVVRVPDYTSDDPSI